MELLGYIASILIGLSLGLIGGGGSILTVPVLVYLLHIDVVLAATYSLFIVGTTSLIGSLSYFRKGLVDLKTAVLFGIPSIISVFLTRTHVMPNIPDVIFQWREISLYKGDMMLLIFSFLMMMSSWSMIKGRKEEPQSNIDFRFSKVVTQGIITGIMTGLVGAGGGFLIIPALVQWLKIPMKNAIGTSLVIISVNSFVGWSFTPDELAIDYWLIAKVTSLAIVGILIGSLLSKKIEGNQLKPAFGVFVLVMGIYILIREIWLHH